MSDTSIDEELPMTEGAGKPRSPLVIPVSESVLKVQVATDKVLDSKTAAQAVGHALWAMTAPDPDKADFWDGLLAPLSAPKLIGLPGRTWTEDEDEQTARERAAFLSVVTDLVLQSVPEENRTASVLTSIDLRPYIAAVQANPEAALATTDAKEIAKLADFPNVYAADIWNELEEPGDWSTWGTELLGRATVAELEAVRASRGDGAPLSEAEISQIIEITPDAAGLNSAARLEAADQLVAEGATLDQAAGVATGELDPWAVLGGAGDEMLDGPALTFDAAQIEEWARTGQVTLDTMLADQVKGEQSGQLGPGQNVYDFKLTPQRSMPGDVGMGNPSMRTFSVVQAVDFLHGLDDATFTQMQDKLGAAGYFARLGVRPERGYQWDEATQQAWELALTDSVQRGTDIPTLLGQQAREWQERSQQRLRQFSVKDTRFAANQIAQEVLGRNLNGEEYEVVKTFLQNLQNERREQLGQGDNLDWLTEGMDLDVGLGEADYSQAVEEAVGDRAYGDRAFDGLQKLNQALGFTSTRPNDPQRED